MPITALTAGAPSPGRTKPVLPFKARSILAGAYHRTGPCSAGFMTKGRNMSKARRSITSRRRFTCVPIITDLGAGGITGKRRLRPWILQLSLRFGRFGTAHIRPGVNLGLAGGFAIAGLIER